MSNSNLITATKACSTCKTEKPVSSFSKKARLKDGLNSQCKQCVAASFKRYYERTREAQIERAKAYLIAHPVDKELQRVRSREYNRKNKEKISERKRARYAADKRVREQNRDRAARWYLENKDRHSKYQRSYYIANTEAVRARIRAYEKANIEKVRVWHKLRANQRRARLAGSAEKFTAADIERLMSLQKCRCANCRTSLKDGYHIDHKIPVAKGGDNGRHNIELLCPACNLKKSAKLPHEFAHENGRLL